METKNFKYPINLAKECVVTWFALALSLVAALMFMRQTLSYFDSQPTLSILYIFGFLFVLYGNVVYLLCRYGYLKRLQAYRPATDHDLRAIYHENAPTITFLLPSYKEDARVIRQSLFSSALQDRRQDGLRRQVRQGEDPGEVRVRGSGGGRQVPQTDRQESRECMFF